MTVGRKTLRYFWTFLSLLLIAAYTGPGNRTVTTSSCSIVLYECAYSSSLGYHIWSGVSAWACSNESFPWLAHPTRPATCSAANVGARGWVEENNSSSTTYPPATISATLTCATPGSGGWCRGGLALPAAGVEPIPGRSITAIGSSVYGVLCAGPSCTWSGFPQGVTTQNVWAVSNFGDTSLFTTLTGRLDSVPPTLTVNLPVTPASGWHTAPVTASASGADATSGLASAEVQLNGGAWSSTVTATADGTHTLGFRAMDNAGNLSSEVRTARVDRTPPVITPPALGATWYTAAPPLLATVTDATSGVAASELRANGGAWGSGAPALTQGVNSLEYRAFDIAGNTATAGPLLVRLDSVAPALTILLPAPTGASGWYTAPVTTAATASDATSGVSAIQVRANGGAWGASATVSADGVHTLDYRAFDIAGNSSTDSRTVRVDQTPPALDQNVPAPDGVGGWYVSPVTISASGADATSGLASAQVRVNGDVWAEAATIPDDGTHELAFRAVDNAGNVTTSSRTVQVDRTSPAATLNLPAPGGINNWYVAPFSVSVTGYDATSGLASAQVRVNGGAWAEAVTISTDGTHQIEYQVADNAGNMTTSSRTVSLDATPPTLAAPYIAANWYVSPQNFTFAAADTLSGLASLEYSADGGATWQAGGSVALADGQHALQVRAADNAGNLSYFSSLIRIDTMAPVTSITSHRAGEVISGVAGVSGEVGESGSGVLRTECSFDDGGTWIAATLSGAGTSWSCSLDTANEQDGDLFFRVRSMDRAGNLESGESIRLVVSNLPPHITLTPLWKIWERGSLTVQVGNARIASIEAQVFDPSGIYPPRALTLTPSGVDAYTVNWDGYYGDGTNANYDSRYPVEIVACDEYGRCATAFAVIVIPPRPETIHYLVQPPPALTVTPPAPPSPTPTALAPTRIPTISEDEPALHLPPVAEFGTEHNLPSSLVVLIASILAVIAHIATQGSDPRSPAMLRLTKTIRSIQRERAMIFAACESPGSRIINSHGHKSPHNRWQWSGEDQPAGEAQATFSEESELSEESEESDSIKTPQ